MRPLPPAARALPPPRLARPAGAAALGTPVYTASLTSAGVAFRPVRPRGGKKKAGAVGRSRGAGSEAGGGDGWTLGDDPPPAVGEGGGLAAAF